MTDECGTKDTSVELCKERGAGARYESTNIVSHPRLHDERSTLSDRMEIVALSNFEQERFI